MLSLILSVVGSLLALVGLIWILIQARAKQFTALMTSVWIFRSGILVLAVAEVLSIYIRPEILLTDKVMLIGTALVAVVSLALLPQEYQQPGLILERSLSWQAILFSLGTFFGALLFVQYLVALVVAVATWFGVRQARRWAAGNTETGRRQVLNMIFGAQISVVVITFLLLFL